MGFEKKIKKNDGIKKEKIGKYIFMDLELNGKM
jgi:hypothetical protein